MKPIVADKQNVKMGGIWLLYQISKVRHISRSDNCEPIWTEFDIIHSVYNSYNQLHLPANAHRNISIILRKTVLKFTTEVGALVLLLLCIFNSLTKGPRFRNMEECSKTCLWFVFYCVRLLLNITDFNRLIRNCCSGFTVSRFFVENFSVRIQSPQIFVYRFFFPRFTGPLLQSTAVKWRVF